MIVINKNYIMIIIVIIAVISLSGCITDNNQSKTYSVNGLSFNYPSSWMEGKSNSEGAVVSLFNPNNNGSTIVIQQVPLDRGSDLDTVFKNNNQNLSTDPNYVSLSQGATKVNGRDAQLNIYTTIDSNSIQRKHIACWMKMDDNRIYVILLSTNYQDYDNEKENFNQVANSFNVTSSGSTNNTTN